MRGADLIFVTLVGVAYLSLLGLPPGVITPLRAALILIGGIIFIVAGTGGFAAVERAGVLRAVLLYFAFQIPLAAAITLLSVLGNASVLLLVVLAGQSVRVLPRRWVVVVCLLLVASVAVPAPFLFDTERVNVLGAALSLVAAVVFAAVFSYIAVSEQRARTAFDEANRQLRVYAAQVEELATTEERNRMAREIHDGLGHYLTTINMQIQAARALLDSDRGRAEATLAKAQTLAQEALADVRRSVAALRDSSLEHRPLPETLAALVEESKAAGLQTELAVVGIPRRLVPQADLALYRAAQEGLTNVRKHAAATRAELMLDYRDQAVVRLSVRDDGVGAASTHGGFGLLGLRERVRLVGGTVDIRAAPGHGLSIMVELPG